LSVCVSQLRNAHAILLVLIIKLTKETRRRFGEGGIRDGEIGKGRLEGEGVKELYSTLFKPII
jgi:hypothetical protein